MLPSRDPDKGISVMSPIEIRVALSKDRKVIKEFIHGITPNVEIPDLRLTPYKYVAHIDGVLVGFICASKCERNDDFEIIVISAIERISQTLIELVDAVSDSISEDVFAVTKLWLPKDNDYRDTYVKYYADCFFVCENGSLKRLYRLIEPKDKHK